LHPSPDERGALRELALTFPDIDADAGEYASALRWLEVVDDLVRASSEDVEARSRRWAPRAEAPPADPGSTAG
jgi:hypothetical protein